MKGSEKLPWFHYYPSDFARDTWMLSLEEKGAWHEIIDAMWQSPERGILSGTVEMFSRLLGLNGPNTERILSALSASGVYNMKRDGNGVVTLMSRRIVREECARGKTAERVRRHRMKRSCNGMERSCNGDVTTPLLSPPQSPPLNLPSEVRNQNKDTGVVSQASRPSREAVVWFNGQGTPKPVVKHSSRKPDSYEEFVAYCGSRGISQSDTVALYSGWEANGWTRGGKPIAKWKAAVVNWQAYGYLPSQKSVDARK